MALPQVAPRRYLVATAQVAVTAVLLLLLFRGFDWPAFRLLFVRLPFWFYAGSLAAVVSGVLLYAWRWQLLLATGGIRLRYARVLQQYVIGVFANNFLPSTIGGDVAKLFYLGREHGFRAVGVSIAIDRFLGFGLLSTLATVALWSAPLTDPRYLTVRLVLSAATAAFAAAILLVFTGTGGVVERLAGGGRVAALMTRVQALRLDVARAVASPRVWAQSAASVVGYFVVITLVYRQFIGLQGAGQPEFAAVLMAAASAAVLSNVPIAINGLGVREQLHVVLLEPLGLPREAATALSLLLFAHLLLVSLAGGVAWWHLARRR